MKWKDLIIFILILFILFIFIKEVILIFTIFESPSEIQGETFKPISMAPVNIEKEIPNLKEIKNLFEPKGKFKRIIRKKTINEIEIKESFTYKLSAIIAQDKQPAALLVDEKNNSIIVNKGDEVQGFIVEYIGENLIRVNKEGVRITLNLW